MAYLTYSYASMNILGHSETIVGALALNASGDNDFDVIFKCPLSEAQKLNSWDIPRKDMEIVWRGENSLAQNART
jgi:hypothetical protein